MSELFVTQQFSPDFNWYKPGKSLREFHACNVPVRVLIGGRGSGKTTSVGVEVVGAPGLHAGVAPLHRILQITLIGWIPAALWAVYALSQYKTDQKIEKAFGKN